jgi:cbb3-type cytochrome oxidase subunit 1
MEATSPTSGGIDQRNAPSVRLPLSFMLTGLGSLCGGVAWIALQPSILATYHYNQYVIAATHLFVLGWICTIVMGSVYQLVPVALETKLYSEKLAWCQLFFHVVGVGGMVWMFRIWNMTNLAHFGSMFAMGVILFVYNMARTLGRVPKWNVTATAVAAALGWITLAITAGLVIAAGKCDYDAAFEKSPPAFVAAILHGLQSVGKFALRFDAVSAMHAHAHLGLVGCFTMLIVGVSYKLVPMFAISEVQCGRRALVSILLLNAGLVGSFVTILTRSPWKFGFALMICLALAIYGWELSAILRARKRRVLDWGVKYFLTAVAMLLPVASVGAVLAWPGLPKNTFTGQLENLYGFLGVAGFITLAVMGMLYKILPFLIWFGRYSRQIGRARVPSLADLYSASLQRFGYWSYLAGLAVTSGGILCGRESAVRLGGCLLALGVATLACNAVRMAGHYFAPHMEPFNVPATAIAKEA